MKYRIIKKQIERDNFSYAKAMKRAKGIHDKHYLLAKGTRLGIDKSPHWILGFGGVHCAGCRRQLRLLSDVTNLVTCFESPYSSLTGKCLPREAFLEIEGEHKCDNCGMPVPKYYPEVFICPKHPEKGWCYNRIQYDKEMKEKCDVIKMILDAVDPKR